MSEITEQHTIEHKVEPVVTFPGGGRSVLWFDRKSATFPARGVLFEADAPLKSRWLWRPGPFNQGQAYSCTSQSVNGAIITCPVRFCRKPDVRDVVLDPDYRTEFYRETQRTDEWDGEEPAYFGSSVLAAAKVAKARGLVDEFRWCFGLDDVLRTLSHYGPVVVGTTWYSSFDNPVGPRARLEIASDAENRGGHAYELHGINVRRRVVSGTNSWGETWGHKGRFEMSWETLDRLLHEDGEAVTFVMNSAG